MSFISMSRKGILNRFGKATAIFLLGASLLAAGCGGGDKKAASGGGSKKNQVLTIGLTNAPKSFNPVDQPDAAGLFVMRFMFDTLLGEPEFHKFTPHLAESIDSKDKITYTIKLNPKAKWSDGKALTADDVIFTMNLIANPKVGTTLGNYVKVLAGTNEQGKITSGTALTSVKKINDTTVEFKCKRPLDPDYVRDQLGFNMPIYPKHIYEKVDPAKIGLSPEGQKPTVFSGPYKLVKYVTNDHVELAANENYIKGKPKLAKVFLKIQNGTNLVVDLKAGKVQMAAGAGIGKVAIKDIDMLKKEKNLSVKSVPGLGTQFLYINNSRKEFNKPFRLALAHAINRKRLVDQLYKGYAQINPTLYTQASPVFDKTAPNPDYNPEKGKKLLKESGYDVSKPIKMLVPLGNIEREQSADLIQQDLQAIGLDVSTERMDFPTLMKRRRDDSTQIFLMGLTLGADPDYVRFFIPDTLSNTGRINDPKLVDMMEAAAYEPDGKKRTEEYHAIQHYLAENQFTVALYGEDNFIIQSKNLVGGLKPYWNGSLDDIHEWYLK